MSKLLEHVILRPNYHEIYNAKGIIEHEFQYDYWTKSLPYLHFREKWEVRALPPFGGAIIRYNIKHNNKWVSIYFDAYGMLGAVDEPYWEYYDGSDCYRYLLGEEERMMQDITKFLNED